MKAARYIPFVWTWPVDVLLWLIWILPFWVLWGEKLRWEEGCLVFNLKVDSWPSKTWYKGWGGTSIGHAIMYASHVPRIDEPSELMQAPIHRTIVHEQFHVKQFESVTLGGFLWAWISFTFLMLAQEPILAVICVLVMWFTATLQHTIGNWLASIARGERFYRDSYHEQSAYAVDFKYQRTGKRDT